MADVCEASVYSVYSVDYKYFVSICVHSWFLHLSMSKLLTFCHILSIYDKIKRPLDLRICKVMLS